MDPEAFILLWNSAACRPWLSRNNCNTKTLEQYTTLALPGSLTCKATLHECIYITFQLGVLKLSSERLTEVCKLWMKRWSRTAEHVCVRRVDWNRKWNINTPAVNGWDGGDQRDGWRGRGRYRTAVVHWSAGEHQSRAELLLLPLQYWWLQGDGCLLSPVALGFTATEYALVENAGKIIRGCRPMPKDKGFAGLFRNI